MKILLAEREKNISEVLQEFLENYSAYIKLIIVFNVSKNTLKKRVKKDDRIDFEVVENMLNDFLLPSIHEGFNNIITNPTSINQIINYEELKKTTWKDYINFRV